MAVCRRTLEIDAASPSAHALLAGLDWQLCRYEAAEPHLRALAEFKADHADTWRRLARCRRELGDGAGEAAAWDRLLTLAPGDPEACRRNTSLAALQRPGVSPPSGDGTDVSNWRSSFHQGVEAQARGDILQAVAAYRQARPGLAEALAEAGEAAGCAPPSFLIIGAPRSGTTWLKQTLTKHPEVFIRAGEGRYFSGPIGPSPVDYVAGFSQQPGRPVKKRRRDARIVGEKSPTYLVMPPERIALAAALFPHLRLVCMVREPVSRFWSHLQHLRLGRQAEDLRYLNSSEAPTKLPRLLEFGRYWRHLSHWAEAFPPAQIHLVSFEEIATDPERARDQVLRHIGLAPDGVPMPMADQQARRPRSGPPDNLRRYLEAAYEGEDWDVRSLAQRMSEIGRRSERF